MMYYICRAIEKVYDLFCTLICRFCMTLYGVNKGKQIKFSGLMAIRKYPGSKITVGDNCLFNSAFHSNQIGLYSKCAISTINKGAEISIGKNCGFSGTVIASAEQIHLGDNVRCGANTLIIDTDFHPSDIRSQSNKEVKIGNDVWLGYGVKVLKGVSIGDGSIIGAMSVVTKDIPAGVVAAGNPCRVIRSLK